MSTQTLIGYARTSTDDQRYGLAAQVDALTAAGCKPQNITREHASGAKDRAKLDALIDHLREGDVLVVATLDRLSRDIFKALELSKRIKARGASLRPLDFPHLDTSTATGELVFNVQVSVGQFMRKQMLERQASGIAKAKAEGKFAGRPNSRARRLAPQIREQFEKGAPIARIARDLDVSRGLVHRVLRGVADGVVSNAAHA